MTCNHDLCIRVVAEVVREFIELRAFFGFNGEAVVRKEDRFAFESVVIGSVWIAGAFRQGLVVNIVGAISEGCAIPFYLCLRTRKGWRGGLEVRGRYISYFSAGCIGFCVVTQVIGYFDSFPCK